MRMQAPCLTAIFGIGEVETIPACTHDENCRPQARDGRSVHFRFGQEIDRIDEYTGGLQVDIRRGPEGSSVIKTYQAYQVSRVVWSVSA